MSSTEHWSPQGRVVAIVRLENYDRALQIATALVAGGVRSLEFTLTGKGAFAAIEAVRAALGDDAQVGVGTVLTVEDTERAIAAGAQFVVTPAFRPLVIAACNRLDVPSLCGGFTPSELLAAHEAGAPVVKLFPARQGSPAYLKDVLAPLPFLRVVPTGGIDNTNARAWIDAGAIAVGVGGKMVAADRVAAEDWASITTQARLCTEATA